MSGLVDSHCHLDFPSLQNDLEGVIERAAEAGVGTIVTICTRVEQFPTILEIAERFENIYCSVGLHPHDAAQEQNLTTVRLVELATHEKVVGIGETGLDYHYNKSSHDIQARMFRRHIAASRELQMPLIVHSRAADDEMVNILQDEFSYGAFPGVLHCFSSSPKLADAALELGFYISFSGILTFKNAQEVRDIAAEVPLNRLLVETDAPYLAPVPHRGTNNEPAYVALTAAKLASMRGLSMTEITEQTTENFQRLFSKAT